MTAINPAPVGGARQHVAIPGPALPQGEAGFLVSSPCQRQFFVPFSAVARDYAEFLMHADQLSLEQALQKTRENAEFVPTWFYEQCACWSDIDRLGRVVKGSTLFKTKKALDNRRGSFKNADIEEQGIEEAVKAYAA